MGGTQELGKINGGLSSPREQLLPKNVRILTRKIFLDYAAVANLALHSMVETGQGRFSI